MSSSGTTTKESAPTNRPTLLGRGWSWWGWRSSLVSVLVAGILVVLALGPPWGAGDATPIAYSSTEMRQAVGSYRAGKLAESWEYFVESLDGEPAEMAFEDFLRCRDDPGCPHMSWLGTVLGEKFPSAAPRLCDRLPRRKRPDCQVIMRRYIRFHDEGPHVFEPQVLAIRHLATQGLSAWPLAEIELDGVPQLALVDTGATKTVFKPTVEHKSRLVAEGMLTDSEGDLHRTPMVRVESLAFGSVRLSDPKLFVYDSLDPEVPSVVIGMDMLLRYPAVCFDWRRETLHLGELGPCAGGDQAFGATLDRGLLVGLSLLTHSGERIRGMLDTGAISTYCPERVVDREASGWEFAMGEQPWMRFECGHEDADVTRDGSRVLVGMRSLGRFAAFGWKLDPLQVYFVEDAGDDAGDAIARLPFYIKEKIQ